MPDRSRPPRIYDISQLNLPKPERYELSGGIPVYGINMGTQEVLKLELIFFAGRPFEAKPLVARATAALLKEGTRHYDSADIAERLDFYGSSLSFPFDLDTSNVVLYSLTKYFAEVVPILADILAGPVFPAKELENYKTRNQQRLRVDLQKNDIVAYRKITECIFGTTHPYGYNSYPENYDGLQREDLVDHYQRFYTSGNCRMIISGRYDEAVIELLDRELAAAIRRGPAARAHISGGGSPPGRIFVEHPDTVQTAIRVGRRLFNRHHPDYHGLYVLNTILGGYFGSRLMENIREEKGYTYNVYSMIDTMRHDGFFYIGTEVGNEFVEDTLTQIYRELRNLQEKPAGDDELEMVRNYLLGYFLTTLDGPFHCSDWIKSLVTEELPADFFEIAVETVRSISAKELRDLAARYFAAEDMWEVVVGQSGQ